MVVPLSWLEIIGAHPIGNRLDGFRSKYSSLWKDKVDLNNDREGDTHTHTRGRVADSDRLKTSSPGSVSYVAKS